MEIYSEKLLLQAGGMMAYRYFIKLAYNGTAYGGWQIQPNTVTVQQSVENALSAIIHVEGGVTGCGRTDAGVSAGVFYAHFDHEKPFSGDELEQVVFRLNRFLPHDIVVFEIIPVIPAAHARFSALWREYEYLIIRKKDPFNYNNAFLVNGDLSVDSMNECTELMNGRHDFQSFSKVHTQVNNYFCTIEHAQWAEYDHFMKFTIRADRFLRNMVRAVVGSLLDVGRGKISGEQFQQIINSHNRCEAGYSVPAKGLTLTGVGYPEDIFLQSPAYFMPEEVAK